MKEEADKKIIDKKEGLKSPLLIIEMSLDNVTLRWQDWSGVGRGDRERI